jgi:uridine kinase
MTPFVLGVAGATGSGKSTLAFGLQDTLPKGVMVFHIDDYFKPKAEVPVYKGMANWDDPKSLHENKMVADLARLKAGESVIINTKSPRHNPDFAKTEQRIPVEFKSQPIIVVEGFLALHFPRLRELYDLSIFLEAPFDLRLSRRSHFMYEEYKQKVLPPMYAKHVEPSRKFADLVLDVTEMPETEVLAKVSDLISAQVTTD